MGKWAVRLGWAMVVPVVLLGIVVLGLRLFFIPMSVQSGSMIPVLEVGDLILVKQVDPQEDLAVGDIITYHRASDDATIVHRVIELDKVDGQLESLVTKGDANHAADPAIVPSQVIGRVAHTIPKAGILWVRTPGRIPPVVIGGIAYLAVLTVLITVGDRAGGRRPDSATSHALAAPELQRARTAGRYVGQHARREGWIRSRGNGR